MTTSTPPARNNTAQIELERTPPPCDRCRHPALTLVCKRAVVFETRGLYSQRELWLSFCGHHYTTLEALLVLAGWALIADTRAQLATRERTRNAGGLR